MKRFHDPYDLPGATGGRFSNHKVPHWRYHNPDILQYLHLLEQEDETGWPQAGYAHAPLENTG